MKAVYINQTATILRKELSPNLIQQLQSLNINKTEQHLSLGITVRNILRRSNIQFDDVWLDGHWYEILHEAINHSKTE